MKSEATPGSAAFRGECLSLATQLELYAKIEGMLPGVVAAMRESAAALRLAAKPAEETIPVPKVALDWLNGEAPDADGKWFGECIPQSDVTPKRAYWWRSKFRSMIPALSTTGNPKP